MKITDAKVIVCSPSRNFVTLKIVTEDGLTGLAMRRSTAGSWRLPLPLRTCHPLLIGRDARRIEDTWHYLYKGVYWRKGAVTMTAIAAVDMALWDIAGKAANKPVYQLFGGASRDEVLVYSHASGATLDETVAAVADHHKAGYRAIRAQCAVPATSTTTVSARLDGNTSLPNAGAYPRKAPGAPALPPVCSDVIRPSTPGIRIRDRSPPRRASSPPPD